MLWMEGFQKGVRPLAVGEFVFDHLAVHQKRPVQGLN
jgi:hypothetical protein